MGRVLGSWGARDRLSSVSSYLIRLPSFCSVSKEEVRLPLPPLIDLTNPSLQNSSKHHKIVPNGYNLGRDWLVNRAIAGSQYKDKAWVTKVEWRTDLLEPGRSGAYTTLYLYPRDKDKKANPGI